MSRASILAKAIGADGILNVGDVAGLATIASSGSATDLTTGTIPVARVGDASVTLAKLSATGTKDSTTFLRGDNSFAVVSVTPTAVSDQNNTSTGAFDVPAGTTAQRPVSPSIGMIRYNTDTVALENYSAAGWLKVSVAIPTVTSISGSIFNTIASTLVLTGTSFGISNATVRFISGGVTTNVTSITPTSSTSISVAVPSAVYNLTAGSSVDIHVINSDLAISAPAQTLTVIGVPSGGTITTSGSYRYHTFTDSGNFVVPSGFSRASDYLILGGGGGGGGRVGGGGGAGGFISGQSTPSANTYSIVIGAGGTGGFGGLDGAETNGNTGTNTTALSQTAFGGGYGLRGDTANGGNGGSGGGGGYDGSGGSGTVGQGNNGGGSSGGAGTYPYKQGGGGGASSAGTAGSSSTGICGQGGNGSNWQSLGTFYAGGGGGGSHNPINSSQPNNGRGLGGTGGGGNAGAPGGKNAGDNANVNTGSGGGGASTDSSNSYKGGNGGSGIVIIRYIP